MKLETLNESQIIVTFVALALLLVAAHIFGNLLEKIKGPRVVGEIIGGMLIGGSGLFLVFPQIAEKIFFGYQQEGQVLNIFSNSVLSCSCFFLATIQTSKSTKRIPKISF